MFADSAHVMLSGTLTIPCGRKATADGPLIGIFGLKAGVAATGPFTTTLRPSATPTQTQGTFWNSPSLANVLPGAAPTYPQDGTNAIASVTGNRSTSELTIGSFAATSGPAITTKATVSSVVVTVAHDETAGVGFGRDRPQVGDLHRPAHPGRFDDRDYLYVSEPGFAADESAASTRHLGRVGTSSDPGTDRPTRCTSTARRSR